MAINPEYEDLEFFTLAGPPEDGLVPLSSELSSMERLATPPPDIQKIVAGDVSYVGVGIAVPSAPFNWVPPTSSEEKKSKGVNENPSKVFLPAFQNKRKQTNKKIKNMHEISEKSKTPKNKTSKKTSPPKRKASKKRTKPKTKSKANKKIRL